jgi:hypothetical protein
MYLDTPWERLRWTLKSEFYCKAKANPDYSRRNNEVVKAAAGIFGPRFECHGHHIADAAPD